MVSCGESHTLLVDKEGNIFSCGSNKLGQLGIGKS
jgi:alpha-tubulin suppressor-like RCC1 family protein